MATGRSWKGRAMKQRYDTYHFTRGEWLVYGLQAAALSLALNYLFYRSIPGMLLAVPVGWLYYRERRRLRERSIRQQLHYHFKDGVFAIHTALRAGYSLENAVEEACSDLKSMYGSQDVMVRELYLMCNQLKLKVPVEELFEDLGRRSGIDDIQNFAGVIQIAKRTGGNLDLILQDIWLTLSGKIETKQEIDASVASKRYEQSIMSLMPAGIILYLQVSFPELLESMYHSETGVLVMSVCLFVYGAAYLLGRKIVEIEV